MFIRLATDCIEQDQLATGSTSVLLQEVDRKTTTNGTFQPVK